MTEQSDAAAINRDRWRTSDFVEAYASTALREPEATILEGHRDALAGRVLELGCGGGRVTGHLIALGGEVHGIDISPAMVAHCRRAYPAGHFEEGDVSDLGAHAGGSFDAVVAPWNVLDVFGDAERRRVLDEVHRVLRPGGLFVMSSHNRAFMPRLRGPTWLVSRHPRLLYERVTRFPVRVRNHRRLRRLERSEPGYAIVNDDAHDYSLLHYYIDPDAQRRQLTEHRFAILEVRDGSGALVEPGDPAAAHGQIHYVARAA